MIKSDELIKSAVKGQIQIELLVGSEWIPLTWNNMDNVFQTYILSEEITWKIGQIQILTIRQLVEYD